MGTKLTQEYVRETIASFGGKLLSNYMGATETILVSCSCGHERTVKFHQFINKNDSHMCHECSGLRILTTEYVRNIVEGFGCKLIGEYINSGIDILVQCPCGNIRQTLFHRFEKESDTHLCEKCSDIVRANHKRIKPKEIKTRFLSYGFQVLDENSLNGSHAKTDVMDRFGYKYQLTASQAKTRFENKTTPEKFSIRNPFTFENMKVWESEKKRDFEIIEYKIILKKDLRVDLKCLKCEERWDTDWYNIYSCKSGCPYCSNYPKKVTKKNSFGLLYQNLLLDWNWNKNTENPYNCTKQTNKKVFWKCHICGYEWISPVSRRTGTQKGGCAACAGKIPTKINNFAIKYPDLLLEWDYESNGNPYNYLPHTHKKVYWICICGMRWKKSIDARTRFDGNGTGCPHCRSSKPVKLIRKILTKNNVKFIPEYRFVDCRSIEPLPFDLYLPKYNAAIEYDGEFHFNPIDYRRLGAEDAERRLVEVQNRDAIKTKYCDDNNIGLLRIPYWQQKEIPEILTSYLHL